MQDEKTTDIILFTNKILIDAIEQRASDIHLEPNEKSYRIRLRVDGILHEYTHLTLSIAQRLTTRIKVLAQLDIAERRLPQDGHFNMCLSQRQIDLRVSCCPTVYGEKIVLRILEPNSLPLSIEKLGFDALQQKIYLKYLQRQQGMILITGPTGSGKTVTLYSGLRTLNTMQLNITTIEDPVEIHLEGINQININVKAGLQFTTALRAILRQDPDVIMLGEIRDLETAKLAVNAAQTGHLVLATLHTSNATDVLLRLMNLGVPAYNIASVVSVIIAQRLCRVLCNHCKIPIAELPNEFTNIPVTANIYDACGCLQCNAGYHGRIGIYEVLEITPSIMQIIQNDGKATSIIQHAKAYGHRDLSQTSLEKVYAGITSISEIMHIV